MEEKPFLYLSVDLPPPPLFRDEIKESIIPQVPLMQILSKFDGVTEQEYKTYKENYLKRYEITKLPKFLIMCFRVCYWMILILNIFIKLFILKRDSPRTLSIWKKIQQSLIFPSSKLKYKFFCKFNLMIQNCFAKGMWTCENYCHQRRKSRIQTLCMI